ncbi:RING-H2 finger protein ATL74-like [Panicum miliaceum]|uniref:RING-type E3 ubiquitin transferase n=1 Tax=Panicum miliaceum TaxID=4540 RepID=A0A3L6TVN5_PANMI|nr:RING-H2 finger protein ATL74-like [Panicum miliaceum]
MAVVAAGAVVTVAACATAAAAAVLAIASSSSSNDEARSSATVAPEAEAVSSPAPSRECAVCLSELPAGAEEGRSGPEPAVRALPACGHAFHADCIGRWLPLRPECPVCRRPVLLADGQQAAAGAVVASATPAPPWARPARGIACGFGDGRVVWTRSPSARQ